jgi:hypothetical protein
MRFQRKEEKTSYFHVKPEIHDQLGSANAMNFGRNQKPGEQPVPVGGNDTEDKRLPITNALIRA